MRRASKIFGALLLVCCLLFAAGVVRLFVLRLKAGDIYPPYSSLRPDPLGSKVFYESLALLPNVRVSRNFASLMDEQKKLPPGATLFILGIPPRDLLLLDASVWSALRAFAAQGARVVLALNFEELPADAAEKAKCKSCEEDSDGCADEDFAPARLGFKMARCKTGADSRAALRAPLAELPERLVWSGATAFEALAPEWMAVYSCQDMPVVIESKLGRGSIVLVAGSFYFSNEAMGFERQSDLLGWFAGRASDIIFDETHFGLAETPGLAKFVGRYRLHGFVAGLFLLGVFFIWRQSAVFVPVSQEAPSPGGLVAGRDSLGGLAGLLARRIPRNRLLFECVRAWNRSSGKGAVRQALPVPDVPKAQPRDEQILKEHERLRSLANERKAGI